MASNLNYIGGDINHSDSVRMHPTNATVDYLDKRGEVIHTAQRLLQKKPVKVMRDGMPYTIEHVFLDVSQHNMHNACMEAVFKGNHLPMRDLIIRCANRAISQYLFEGEDLGFSL